MGGSAVRHPPPPYAAVVCSLIKNLNETHTGKFLTFPNFSLQMPLRRKNIKKFSFTTYQRIFVLVGKIA